MKKRIYIDNSVIGGYFDDEFEEETKLFFDQIKKGEYYVFSRRLMKQN